MLDIEINDQQVKSLYRALDHLDREHIIDPVLREVGSGVLGKIKPYPPPVVGSDRTGRLGRSWYSVYSPGAVQIKNLAEYAGYVVGEEQMSYHKAHGWKQLLDVVSEELKDVVRKIERRIDEIWRR